MNLTTGQQATVKAWLDANASGQSDDAAAALLNAAQSPSYFVWHPAADKAAVDAQIVKAAMPDCQDPEFLHVYHERDGRISIRDVSVGEVAHLYPVRDKFDDHLDHASTVVAAWPDWKRRLLGGR